VTESTSAARRPTWIVATIAGAFALLYAYAVWNAVAQLVQSVQTMAAAGLSLNALGWIVWLLAIALPIALFAIAVSVGRTRGLRTLAILLLVGLSIVAVFWLDVVAYTTINTINLIG
jgi:hypothetical protein